MNPLRQLILTRIREFYREPAAVFWVYGFPLLIAVALGVAFRVQPVEKLRIELICQQCDPGLLAGLRQKLAADSRLELSEAADAGWQKRLRSGKADAAIGVTLADGEPRYEIWEEKNRPESMLARQAVENALLKADRSIPLHVDNHQLEEKGVRYIDFLIPGLMGMNLMGGGLFGVGFVIVDMRVRKLLKRFIATPMRRGDFMLSIMISRLLFLFPEILILLLFAWLAFDVTIQGSIVAVFAVVFVAAACFAGLGLLVACRAKTIETVSGLMNLLMLPMYVVSGVFFSSERFPDAMQPFIKALPLTACNDALRAIMLDGQSLFSVWLQLTIMAAWGIVSFAVALKLFRWK